MKRFTETNKWRDPWFRKLSIRAKALFLWLVDHCDNAGVIDLDLESASFDIGEPIKQHHIVELSDRLKQLESGKLWLPKFVPFQYGTLTSTCTPHARVLELLSHHGLNYPFQASISTTLPTTLPTRVGTTLKEEDNKGIGKEEDKTEGRGMQGGRVLFAPPTLKELQFHAVKIGLPESEANRFFYYYASNGWKVGRNPMKSWPHALQNWKIKYDTEHTTHSAANRGSARAVSAERNSFIIGADEVKRRVEQEQRDLEAGNVKLPCDDPEYSAAFADARRKRALQEKSPGT